MYFPFHFELLSSLCLDAQRFFTFSLTPSRFAWVSFRAVPLQFTPRVRAVCFPWAALLRVWSVARFSPGSHSTRVLDLLCLSVASSIIDTSFHLFWFFFLFKPYLYSFLNIFISLLIFGCVESSWLCADFPLGAVSGSSSLLRRVGCSLLWLLWLWSTGSRARGLSSCSMPAQALRVPGSRVPAQELWCVGLVALRHVGSSLMRGWTLH